MSPFKSLRSKTVVIPVDNIDTDQIIPARFLTTTTRSGLGANLFHAWRFDDRGETRPDFPLNDAKDCRILVAGRNFGCGSSREHAPWALLDFGIQAVVSSEIADIFRSNALKNGLVPAIVDEQTHRWLLDNPGAEIEIDVAAGVVRLPDGRECPFPMDEFSRHCLIEGVDELGYLMSMSQAVEAYEAERAL